MTQRRTVAPDIVGCTFILYASALLFAVLRAPYVERTVGAAVEQLAIYGGLLLVCVALGIGLFQRRAIALWPGIALSIGAVIAGATGFHVPDTAQLPAGVLGTTGAVLLFARRGELWYQKDPENVNTSEGETK